jgi:antitoxin component YwqK of YwqJK toxin-antitoxin module
MQKKIFLLITFAIFACKTNQTHNKLKVGKWIYTDTVNNICYKTVGKYQKNIEKGTWKSFEGEKLVKEEKYKNGICHTKVYHQNGQLSSEGKTKLAENEIESHWFYFDQWNFYDESGKLIETKFYKEGELDEIRKEN